MPGMPSCVAHLAERHLQLLERADQPVDAAEMVAHERDRVRELVGIEAVLDLVVPGELRAERSGRR